MGLIAEAIGDPSWIFIEPGVAIAGLTVPASPAGETSASGHND